MLLLGMFTYSREVC